MASGAPAAATSWLDHAKARFLAYVAQIPGQTSGLFFSAVVLSVLNIFTLDLVSAALSVDRTTTSVTAVFTDPVAMCVAVLSVFSSAHGLISTLLAIYFGNHVFSLHEHKLTSSSSSNVGAGAGAAFFPSLLIGQLGINVLALSMNAVWRAVFPLGEEQFASQRWGGMMPLICLLESAYSQSGGGDEDKVVTLPLPFTIPKPYRGVAYALIFSMLRGGDVDLFAASALGYAVALLSSNGMALPRVWWTPSFAWLGSSSSTHSYSALPATTTITSTSTAPPITTTTTSTHAQDAQVDVEAQQAANDNKRAVLLAATERRLNKI